MGQTGKGALLRDSQGGQPGSGHGRADAARRLGIRISARSPRS